MLVAIDSASYWQRKKALESETFDRLFCLPPEPTGAARGYNVNVTRRLAALAPRVAHVCLPCQAVGVAGESVDGARASYLRLDPLGFDKHTTVTLPR